MIISSKESIARKKGIHMELKKENETPHLFKSTLPKIVSSISTLSMVCLVSNSQNQNVLPGCSIFTSQAPASRKRSSSTNQMAANKNVHAINEETMMKIPNKTSSRN